MRTEIDKPARPVFAVLCIPALEELAIGDRRRLGLEQALAGLDDLRADKSSIHAVEVIGGELRRALGRHDVDGEVAHVETLRGGVCLTGGNRAHARAVVRHVVYAHSLAGNTGIEEAHVHCGVGLYDAAVGAEERYVDGDGILQFLALLLYCGLDRIDDSGAGNLHGLHGGSLGQHAFGSSHLHEHVARLGVALESRAAHVGLDFDDIVLDRVGPTVVGAVGLGPACPILADLHVGGDGFGSRRLKLGSFGFRGFGLHLQDKVARHLFGRNLVLPGGRIGPELGFDAFRNGLDRTDLVAFVGVGGERKLLVQGYVDGIGRQRDGLPQVCHVRMLEFQAHHSHAGLGSGEVGCRSGGLGGRRLALRSRLGDSGGLQRGGGLGLGRRGGFGSRVVGDLG